MLEICTLTRIYILQTNLISQQRANNKGPISGLLEGLPEIKPVRTQQLGSSVTRTSTQSPWKTDASPANDTVNVPLERSHESISFPRPSDALQSHKSNSDSNPPANSLRVDDSKQAAENGMSHFIPRGGPSHPAGTFHEAQAGGNGMMYGAGADNHTSFQQDQQVSNQLLCRIVCVFLFVLHGAGAENYNSSRRTTRHDWTNKYSYIVFLDCLLILLRVCPAMHLFA